MRILTMEPIVRGWSTDRKFCVTDEHGAKYLLRISSPEKYDAKRRSFEMMQKVAELGVPMCQPVAFGRWGQLKGTDEIPAVGPDHVYSLQSWIDGTDLEEAVKTMDAEAQYECGLQAGEILRKIHQIPAPEGMESWEDFFNRKVTRKIEMARECPLKFRGQEEMIDFLETHRHLLKGRPRVYQHGDYHIGNLMLDTDGRLHVIDFDRDDFGDPWEEFNRIVFCKDVSVDYAEGRILGYFGQEVLPQRFWELFAFYMAANQIASPAWGLMYGREEGEKMIRLAEDVCSWFDGMKETVPNWFRQLLW